MNKKLEENKLILIPKSEKHIEYVLDIIIKLPRTEKFSIDTEYKLSMYKMIEKIMYLNKINKSEKKDTLFLLNEIDSLLNTQWIYLRIIKKYKGVDGKKFKVAMELYMK